MKPTTEQWDHLSPAAQAVLNAFNAEARPEPHHQREAIAAALRAVADRVLPEERPTWEAHQEWTKRTPDSLPPWSIRDAKHQEILAIATELEGTNG